MINLSLVPFFPTTGLPCQVTLPSGTVLSSNDGWVILDEERGQAGGRVLVVCHNDIQWGDVQAFSPARTKVEVDLSHFNTRQRALRHIHESLPGTPLFHDAPVDEVRRLLLRATTHLAAMRVKTPSPAYSRA